MRVPALLILCGGVAILGCPSSPDVHDGGQEAGADAAQEAGEDGPALACPATRPEYGARCSGALCCEYGEDACCGQSSAGVVCNCEGGRFTCLVTDACLVPECPDGGLTPPPWGHCPAR